MKKLLLLLLATSAICCTDSEKEMRNIGIKEVVKSGVRMEEATILIPAPNKSLTTRATKGYIAGSITGSLLCAFLVTVGFIIINGWANGPSTR